MSARSFYDILGVAADASPARIRAAFQRLAKKHHPDRPGGDAKQMEEIQSAYNCLKDPRLRAAYDADGVVDGGKALLAAAEDIISSMVSERLDWAVRDLIGDIRARLRDDRLDLSTKVTAQRQVVRKLERWRGRVKRRHPGENLVEAALIEKIASAEAVIKEANRVIEIGRIALDILEDYVDEGEPNERRDPAALAYDPIRRLA